MKWLLNINATDVKGWALSLCAAIALANVGRAAYASGAVSSGESAYHSVRLALEFMRSEASMRMVALVLVLSVTLKKGYDWIMALPIHAPKVKPNYRARIAIVGGGPGGLSCAYYLRKAGFEHVTVLEKELHVGGQCKSRTDQYMSFDLGANYVTPSYDRVLRMASELGVPLYTGPGRRMYNANAAGKAPFTVSVLWHTIQRNTGSLTPSPCAVAWAMVKISFASVWYLVHRVWLDVWHGFWYASFARAGDMGLGVPFEDWLKARGLMALAPVFEIPITHMGYGRLHQIAACYALRYMAPLTFVTLMWVGVGCCSRWPLRFEYGFQRFWETVAACLHVRTGVTINSIARADTGDTMRGRKLTDIDRNDANPAVLITMTAPDRLNPGVRKTTTEPYDALILGCTLNKDVLKSLGMPLTRIEAELLHDAVKTNDYCMTTHKLDLDAPFQEERLVLECVDAAPGEPGAIAKVFASSTLYQFYSPAYADGAVGAAGAGGAAADADEKGNDFGARDKPTDDDVKAAVKAQIARLYANNGVSNPPAVGEPHTFDRFPYFPHFTPKAIRSGCYARLEASQGARATYYVGGLMAFHLVEPIVDYSADFVDRFGRKHSKRAAAHYTPRPDAAAAAAAAVDEKRD